MANHSSSSAIICASFNQDNCGFAIGSRDGFRIFDAGTGRLCYQRAVGAFSIVEMLFSTSLLAVVGAGEQPSLSPRRLCLFNTDTGAALRELNFLTSILAIRMNKKWLIVLLQDKIYIYDLNSLTILDTVDTVPNTKGLCAFSPSLDVCYLGLFLQARLKDLCYYFDLELNCHYILIHAHRSPLAAMALSSNGMYMATASEQGTIIRVHLVSKATKSYSFRRGTYPSTIYSLSFGPSKQLPDILVATSCSGSVHVFSLALMVKQKSKRSSGIFKSMVPRTINDAFEPTHHHVLHNAVPPGVKSYVVIRGLEKPTGASPSSHDAISRANVSIITHNGYFQEYSLSINHLNECSWSMEREFNLLTAIV
ncbi:hypothetical protein Scep_023465 [Stephania cephalantha]|uniref:Autophagy-related protein 18b n=1 Tax=Stephania cephalantha TaxID=152367 RepID=A0AAP0HXJ9_9MAGN